ncbi:MAG TPA: SPFH domain-containing protein [Caldisericia bacterium]|nr:SPFH domain-containing protein [Caldisericia bacterium]HPF49392.1 SPFH domain-containing protein [Caldisericia bacterium]HPI84405.1 SPFH domain-containing protein [Caldisericia bacterium]HPQ93563.1 SPFH domain-containing protein [Caldisericia bacterium]HRV75532.1 SPFH domain-containing protein [Caldisericia bacterium]
MVDGVWILAAIVGGIICFIIIIGLFVSNYLKAEPNEALILTGRRHRVVVEDKHGRHVITRGWRAVVGGAAFKIPVIEKVSKLSLELMNLSDVRVINAYSMEGVPVTIDAVANVKISSEDQMLARAVERFLGSSKDQVKQIIKETLEGQLRDIIGVLTVEQLYRERDMFVQKTLDQTGDELAKIGVIIDIINIQDIRDEKGYLEALGERRTAEVKRDAAVGTALAQRDAMIQSENARREGETVKAEQERMIAEAQKERDVAKQNYRGETFAAEKRADQKGPLAEAQMRQEVVVEQQKVSEAQENARMKVETARALAEEQRYRAEVVIPADAQKQSKILEAEGESQRILRIKEAEAEGIRKVAMAEADGLRAKADAWNQFGEAAKLNLVLETYRQVAAQGAQAIGNISFDKVVAIDGGGGSEGGSSVTRLMNAAPGALVKFMEQMKAATGIDIEDFLKGYLGNKAKTVEVKQVESKPAKQVEKKEEK